ncbi:hypothetical protein RCL1_002987 [Eukaryota sp. TZLM3-RCL]
MNNIALLETRLDAFIEVPPVSIIAKLDSQLSCCDPKLVPTILLSKAVQYISIHLISQSLPPHTQLLLWKIRARAAILHVDDTFLPQLGTAIGSCFVDGFSHLLPHYLSVLSLFLSQFKPKKSPEESLISFPPLFSSLSFIFHHLPAHSPAYPSLCSSSQSLLSLTTSHFNLSTFHQLHPLCSTLVSLLISTSKSADFPSRRAAVTALSNISSDYYLAELLLELINYDDLKFLLNDYCEQISQKTIVIYENLLRVSPYRIKNNFRLIEKTLVDLSEFIFSSSNDFLINSCISVFSNCSLSGISPCFADILLCPVIDPPIALLPDSFNHVINQLKTEKSSKINQKLADSSIIKVIDDKLISKSYELLFPPLSSMKSTSISSIAFEGIHSNDSATRTATCHLLARLGKDLPVTLDLCLLLISKLLIDPKIEVKKTAIKATRDLISFTINDSTFPIDSITSKGQVLMSLAKIIALNLEERRSEIRNIASLIVADLCSLKQLSMIEYFAPILENLVASSVQTKKLSGNLTSVLIGFVSIKDINELKSNFGTNFSNVISLIEGGFNLKNKKIPLSNSILFSNFKIFCNSISIVLPNQSKMIDSEQDLPFFASPALNIYSEIFADLQCNLLQFPQVVDLLTPLKYLISQHFNLFKSKPIANLVNFYDFGAQSSVLGSQTTLKKFLELSFCQAFILFYFTSTLEANSQPLSTISLWIATMCPLLVYTGFRHFSTVFDKIMSFLTISQEVSSLDFSVLQELFDCPHPFSEQDLPINDIVGKTFPPLLPSFIELILTKTVYLDLLKISHQNLNKTVLMCSSLGGDVVFNCNFTGIIPKHFNLFSIKLICLAESHNNKQMFLNTLVKVSGRTVDPVAFLSSRDSDLKVFVRFPNCSPSVTPLSFSFTIGLVSDDVSALIQSHSFVPLSNTCSVDILPLDLAKLKTKKEELRKLELAGPGGRVKM